MNRWTRVVVVAVPGLILAGFSLIHPAFLDMSTATAWWQLHIPLIPMFPLLAVGMWVLLRGETGILPWVARIAAYLYAVLYTGIVTDNGAGQVVGSLFAVGDELGHIGVWCLAGSTVVAAAALFPKDGPRVLPGTVVLLVAAWGFYRFHIFTPYGGLSMLGYAIGFALLAAARQPTVVAETEPVAAR